MSGSGARPKYSVVPGSGGVPTPFDQHFDTPEAMEEDLSSGGPTGATQLTNKWNTIVETSGTFPPAVFNIITLSHAQEDLLIKVVLSPERGGLEVHFASPRKWTTSDHLVDNELVRGHFDEVTREHPHAVSSSTSNFYGKCIQGKLASLVYYSRTFLGTDRSGGGAMHETGKPDPRD
ncbi:hypothetical protein BDZ97DRAFT_1994622 [Flammula alnicola]|nr:hypothetical protein BDZ97DRAFT_1994622 [Flammula alnicola]